MQRIPGVSYQDANLANADPPPASSRAMYDIKRPDLTSVPNRPIVPSVFIKYRSPVG